jgi:glycosyltransferase involved in cell wall biosynthesis
MKKILLIHPEGNINNNPNLTGIVEILCENNFEVHYCYVRHGYMPQQYPPCQNVTLMPLNENVFIMGSFPIKDNYSLIIGVDRGIIQASHIAQMLHVPFGLISYEIIFAEETGPQSKKSEIDACRGLSFAVCQDKNRASLLYRENRIPIEKIINIPVAGRSVIRGERTYALNNMLNIDRDKKIALYIGEPTAKWAAFEELFESSEHWNNEWVIVLHQRYKQYDNFTLEKIAGKNRKNIYISPFPVLAFENMHQLLHAADLGLAFYLPQRTNASDGNNLLNIGMSSGKISTYLQHGLPIMINELGEMSSFVQEYQLGRVIKSIYDSPLALQNLTTDNLSEYRNNCYRFFEEKLDLNVTMKPLLSTIHSLPNEDFSLQTDNHEKISACLNDYDVSIILATKNRAQLLDDMLTSLENASVGVRYEVIVIEGNSSDNTIEILHKHGIEHIYNEKEHFGEGKHSWSQLYNFGFAKAKGKWAMYASDDILFHESCIARAVEILKQQPPEVAGGIFFYKNMSAEPAWKDFGIDFTYGQKLLLNYGLIRLDYFKEVNGLDEHYNFYCADGDLCYKLYEKGKEFIPLESCFVTHVNIYDSNKQINYSKADEDIQDYKRRWAHFVTTDVESNPRRLMWHEVAEFIKKKQEKSQIDTNSISCHMQEPHYSQTTSLDQLKEKGIWSEGKPLRLHLGCGEQRLEGYVNIDHPPSEHTVQKHLAADLFADITILRFPKQSVDEIRLHHVFEHFDRVTALALLTRWHLWLRIGGKLHIETPDLIGSAKTLLSDVSWSVKMGVVRHLAGSHEASWANHIDQWFPERFEHTLKKLGFEPVQLQSVSWQNEPFLSNVHAIATKCCEIPIAGLIKVSEELLRESMVSEKEKPLYEIWRNKFHELISDDTHRVMKPVSSVSEDKQLLEKLQKDFRDVPALTRLAEIELQRSNLNKARKYLIAAMALEPQNADIKALLAKLQQ